MKGEFSCGVDSEVMWIWFSGEKRGEEEGEEKKKEIERWEWRVGKGEKTDGVCCVVRKVGTCICFLGFTG